MLVILETLLLGNQTDLIDMVLLGGEGIYRVYTGTSAYIPRIYGNNADNNGDNYSFSDRGHIYSIYMVTMLVTIMDLSHDSPYLAPQLRFLFLNA